jgi:hypothetical protein
VVRQKLAEVAEVAPDEEIPDFANSQKATQPPGWVKKAHAAGTAKHINQLLKAPNENCKHHQHHHPAPAA